MKYLKSIKYLLGISILLLGGTFSVNAEKHYSANIAVGAKGGVSLSRISFAPAVPQGMLMGTTLGFSFRYIEEKNFGLIAELNMEQRGWKENFEGAPFSYQRKLTYLQLPILTHIFFGNSKFKGFFNAGPELGYLISENTSSNFDVNNILNIDGFPTANRNNEQFKLPISSKFDYGISAGLGMEVFAKRKNSFTLEGRFYYGLGNIFGSRKKDYFSASNSMSIMITLGYMYRIK